MNSSRRLRAAQKPAARIARKVSALVPSATQRQSANLAIATSDPRFASSNTAYWVAQIETQLDAWLHIAERYLVWQEKFAAAPDTWLWPLGEDAPDLRREILQNRALVKATRQWQCARF